MSESVLIFRLGCVDSVLHLLKLHLKPWQFLVLFFPCFIYQPTINNNPWMLLYFISFLLIVSFFVLNMFVGVVVENFHKCRQHQEVEEAKRREEKRLRRMEKKRRSKEDRGLKGESAVVANKKRCFDLHMICWTTSLILQACGNSVYQMERPHRCFVIIGSCKQCPTNKQTKMFGSLFGSHQV